MKKYNIGITFGAYDMFHIGHLNLLKNAKSLCEILIVCVSSDAYIKAIKGHEAVIPLSERLRIIESIKYVDIATIQSIRETKKNNIQRFKPEAIFVGSDWTPKTFSGEGLGVPVVYLDRTPTISSTLLRKKLRRKDNKKTEDLL